MAEKVQHLRDMLSELKGQLAAADDLDSEARDRLQQLVAELERSLAGAQGAASQRQGTAEERRSFVGRLAESAQEYEDSHPTLFGAIGSVINALSRMGI